VTGARGVVLARLGIVLDDGEDAMVQVDRTWFYGAMNFVLEKARQNHKLHESWNEGSNGDFVTCARGDCTEAKDLLHDMGLDF
jgi:hypothetical protein